MSKRIIKINASSLPLSKCIKSWVLTIIEGYKSPVQPANLIYGVAGHAFIDTMFKTDGRMDEAYNECRRAFNVPKYDIQRQMYLSSESHLFPTLLNYWTDYISKDSGFQLLQINSRCWWCDGKGYVDGETTPTEQCEHCAGTGSRMNPATEVTFSIKYYEDEQYEVWLEGTIDKIGKIKGGCYAIGDYKFTSTKDKKGYFADYQMSQQLRFYVLSLKLMGRMYPESVLGQIGQTRLGAFIDGIFLYPSAPDNEYGRSDVFAFTDDDLAEFQLLLDRAIKRLLDALTNNTWDVREGIFNGACKKSGYSQKCAFWFPCLTGNKEIEQLKLAKDFVKKTYDPLHHNE